MKLRYIVFLLPALIALAVVINESQKEDAQLISDLTFNEVYVWNDNEEEFKLANLEISQGIISNLSWIKDKKIKSQKAKFILPGFINAHLHLVNTNGCEAGYDFSISTFTNNLQVLMNQGFTTVADMAGWPYFINNMKTWMIENDYQFPGIYMAGPVISTEGGYPHYWLPSTSEIVGAVELLNDQDPEELYRKLNRLHVDYIKIGLQEITFGGEDLPLIDEGKLKDLIDIAHQQKKKVMVHALTKYGYELGLKLGVDAFIHGPLEILSPDLIQKVISQNVMIIPTIWVWKSTWDVPENNPSYYLRLDEPISGNMYDHYRDYIEDYESTRNNLPDYVLHEKIVGKSLMKNYHHHLISNLKNMRESGVQFAFGTDAPFCFNTIGSSGQELKELNIAGFSNKELLKMMTLNSARLLGKENYLGKIKQSYEADLNIYDVNPLNDIEILLKPDQVVLDGEILDSHQSLSFWDEVNVGWILVKSFFESL